MDQAWTFVWDLRGKAALAADGLRRGLGFAPVPPSGVAGAARAGVAEFYKSLGDSPASVSANLCSICEYGIERVSPDWWTLVYIVVFSLLVSQAVYALAGALRGACAHAAQASAGVGKGLEGAVAWVTKYFTLAILAVALLFVFSPHGAPA